MIRRLLYILAVVALCGAAVGLVRSRTDDGARAVMRVSYPQASASDAVLEVQECSIMEEAAFVMVYGKLVSPSGALVPSAFVRARFIDADGRVLLERRSRVAAGFIVGDDRSGFSVGIPARQDIARAEVVLEDFDGTPLPTRYPEGSGP